MGIQKMIKDKKGVDFKSVFFAIVIISLAIIGIGVWIDDWNDNYDSGLAYDLQEFNRMDEVSVYSEEAKEQLGVKSAATGNTEENFEGTSLRGVYGIVTNIFQPFRIVFGENGFIDSITDRIGLPNYVSQAIVTIMIMAVVFTLVAILFRLGRPSV